MILGWRMIDLAKIGWIINWGLPDGELYYFTACTRIIPNGGQMLSPTLHLCGLCVILICAMRKYLLSQTQ